MLVARAATRALGCHPRYAYRCDGPAHRQPRGVAARYDRKTPTSHVQRTGGNRMRLSSAATLSPTHHRFARPAKSAAIPHCAEEQVSALGKLAFACLWLLVFAIPWEDAISIPGFGTSARLIGVITL